MKCLSVFVIISALMTSHAQTIRVMTYNIRLDATVDGVNQWPHRKGKVFALLRLHNPDIIGLQEVLHHQLQDLLTALPQYGYAGVGRDDGKEKGEYSAILFRKERFELLSSQTMWLSETPSVPGSKSWDAAITRVVTEARLRDRLTGQTLTHFNTHFDHIGQEARQQSARLIREKVMQLTVDTRVIVTGDFNAEPTEAPYREILLDRLLIDTRPASESNGTYCTFSVGTAPCKLIDFIFCNKKWDVLSYRVINDNDGSYYPSDHLPVMVELR
jgi:endonuclease/exonuclease/phosphatase family metal-dependent hydrolase